MDAMLATRRAGFVETLPHGVHTIAAMNRDGAAAIRLVSAPGSRSAK